MIAVVIDTNVLVSAFWKPDSNPATVVGLMLHPKDDKVITPASFLSIYPILK
ncbi:MAG: hypothetical protein FWE23_11200 [Chitinivibrionia bacterium]|nr:hypothetical protein [Chitinivibrionia bacterium]